MKNINIFICLLLVNMLYSCAVDYKSTTIVQIENKSSHPLKLTPYKNGMIDTHSILNLNPGNSEVIEISSSKGKQNEPLHFDPYFIGVDSIYEIWYDTIIVVHMNSGDYISNRKFVSFNDSNKNLGYTSHYKKLTKVDTKNRSEHLLIYTFTESDYEYAKQ